jgi:hypothetical protein
MKITFKKNYNAKLDSSTYLAILPFNPEYITGTEHDIYVATKSHHRAKILITRPTSLSELTNYDTLLDVGITADEYRKTVTDHNPSVDLNDSFLEIVIFQKLPSKHNEKIALFCAFYEKYCGIKYKITPTEIGMIKKAEVTEELLKRFFESNEFWAKVKQVGYYVRNVQELKRMTVQTSAGGHPHVFDKAYLNKLEGAAISSYYTHLRSLGLVAKKNALGTIIDFVKPSELN